MKKFLYFIVFTLGACLYGQAQSVFLEVEKREENIKSQFYFQKKVPYKGVYFHPDGRVMYSWVKKNRLLGIYNSIFTFYKYDLDSTAIQVALNCEIRNDLRVILFSGSDNYFGYFTATKTEGNKEERTFGRVKLLTKQRKFALTEVSDAEIELVATSRELTETHFVGSIFDGIPEVVDADRIIVTNRDKNSTTQTGYFERILKKGTITLLDEVSIQRRANGRTETHMITKYPESEFINYTRRIISTFDEQNKLISIESLVISDSKVHVQKEVNHTFISPYVEVIDTYSVKKRVINV